MENSNTLEMLTRIETKLDIAIGQLEDHERRLRVLEGHGGRRWETLIAELIRLCAAAAAGYFLAGLGG